MKDMEKSVILVVEDEDDYRWLITSGLESDFKVLEAENGKQGLEIAMESIPDLVVTDLMMPAMGGIELCRILKETPDTSHIPVVMLTAKTSVDSQIQGLETGADDYVTKPFNMILLKTRIQNLLETRRLLREQFRGLQEITDVQDTVELETLVAPQLQNRVDREFWGKMCDVLRQRYSDIDFVIDGMANELGMSQRSLQRKVKALCDCTPVQLIAEYRLRQAVKLLHDKSKHVTDVAYEVGFGDLSHFYRLFKKEFGKNPTEYRNNEF